MANFVVLPEEPITIIIEDDQDGTQGEYEFTFNNTTGSIY